MMVIADRADDGPGIEVARAQIEAAYETERAGGDQHLAEFFQAQLPRAQAIRDRLTGETGDCSVAAIGTATGEPVGCGHSPPNSEKKP
jgi:hypothetical protein